MKDMGTRMMTRESTISTTLIILRCLRNFYLCSVEPPAVSDFIKKWSSSDYSACDTPMI